MARYDFSTKRLFVEPALVAGAVIALDRMQTNYLGNVLRLADGAELLVFNGRDGEWTGVFARTKREAHVRIGRQTRPQPPVVDLAYLFAPLKQARLDYVVQKAVEMGVSRLSPVLTQHGQVLRLNDERLRANAIEAAEQCGILALPTIDPLRKLAAHLDGRASGRTLIFCDEDAPDADCIVALRAAEGPVDLLIGPEGGFSDSERAHLLKVPGVLRLSLGPRILRADTAAVAALALIQAVRGDWRPAANTISPYCAGT